MARGGPIQCYRCQVLWPVVGPAIRTIFYGQWWAHSRLSGPYSRPVVGPSKDIGIIFCGPIQDHWDHMLWPVVGPYKALGSHFICLLWAHPWVSFDSSRNSGGPMHDHWESLYMPTMGPYKYIVHISWRAHGPMLLSCSTASDMPYGPIQDIYRTYALCTHNGPTWVLLTITVLFQMVYSDNYDTSYNMGSHIGNLVEARGE